MPLLTIFSAPKPFTNPHIATIQRNAIRSWTHLPDVEVILVGEEEGLAQAAAELGVRHLPNVARNEAGTPLISSIFDLARQNSSALLLCYVNADIILLPDFFMAARQVAQKFDRFLMIGRRLDLDITAPLDFSLGWVERLRAQAACEAVLHSPTGMDYFLFPATCFTELPDFAVGRVGWDNWMIYNAAKHQWPIIDATPAVAIIHQNHDYSHLANNTYYNTPESNENIRLAGGRINTRYTIYDANYLIVRGKIRRPAWSLIRLLRKVELFFLAHNDPPRRLMNSLYYRTYRLRVLLQQRD